MVAQNDDSTGSAITSNDRLFAVLSYIFVPWVSLLVLFMEDTKTRPYPRYHAVQSLGFMVGVAIYEVLAGLIFLCGSLVTFGFGALCLWVLIFVPLPMLVYYCYLASTSVYFDIPVVSKVMLQQGWLSKPSNK